MIHFVLTRISPIQRDRLYSISTDIENFSNIMPRHFKSLKIEKTEGHTVIANERIYFSDVKVKHIILKPEIHEVHIVSGILKGTSFVEHYKEIQKGTEIVINASIKLNGILQMLYPFGFIIKWQMSRVMKEFVDLSEKYDSNRNERS